MSDRRRPKLTPETWKHYIADALDGIPRSKLTNRARLLIDDIREAGSESEDDLHDTLRVVAKIGLALAFDSVKQEREDADRKLLGDIDGPLPGDFDPRLN